MLEFGSTRRLIRSPCEVNSISFRHIEFNLDLGTFISFFIILLKFFLQLQTFGLLNLGSPSKRKSTSPNDISHIDVHSCVHFLVDLYKQWLENSVRIKLFARLLYFISTMLMIFYCVLYRIHHTPYL